MSSRGGSALLLLLACGCPVDGTVNDDAPRLATTERVTFGPGRTEFDGPSYEGVVTPDGRYVALATLATNLDPLDTDALFDVYRIDRLTGETRLVSAGAGGAKGNRDSYDASISDDGLRVLFTSGATNLHPDDPDESSDVYLRDFSTGDLLLVSRTDGAAGAKTNGHAYTPALSGDGRSAAFSSWATNLPDAPASSEGAHAYVRDLTTHETRLVGRADGAAGARGAGSQVSSISRDGRLVTFTGAGVEPGLPINFHHAYVRDRRNHDTILVSRATGSAGAPATDWASTRLPISADGRFVAWSTAAPGLDPDDADAIEDVFVRDLVLQTTALASRADGPSGPKASLACRVAGVDEAGRVLFSTLSPGLATGDADTFEDAFLRDPLRGTTLRVGVRTFGGAPNRGATAIALSPAGLYAVFSSESTDLVDDDTNGQIDLFVRGPLR